MALRVLVFAVALFTTLLPAAAASAQETSIVSRAAGSGTGADGAVSDVAVSGDGRYVAFVSTATNLGGPTDGTAAVYLKDTQSGMLGVVSRASGAAGALANAGSTSASLSADGRYVVFASTATNLGAGGTGSHVYVRDTQELTTTAVDRASGTGPALGGSGPVISGDGRFVAFVGSQDAYSGGSTGESQVYLRNLAANTTELMSRATGAAGAIANESSGSDALANRAIGISSTGRFVAFASGATNLTADPTAGVHQIFLRDREASSTTLVSRSATAGEAGEGDSAMPTVSTSGTVAFDSQAQNLGSGVGGAFERPLGGPTEVASRSPGLAGAVQALGSPAAVAISGDSTTVAWLAATPLAGNAPPGISTSGLVQRRRIADGTQDVADVNAQGIPLGAVSGPLAISGDGTRVAFLADPELVDPAAGTNPQVLLRDDSFIGPPATTGTGPPNAEPGHSSSQSSKAFSFGKVRDNPKNGTATLSVDVPGPGTLKLYGKEVDTMRATAFAAGVLKLSIKPKGKARTALDRTGKAKVTATVTFTPAGGNPDTKDHSIKLVKKH